MIIESCHIENFGKLHDLDLEFTEGLNEFCLENGWGKSTLAAFIRALLYGFSGEGSRKGLANERRRYSPWQGGAYGGSMVFRTDKGRFEITRIFGAKSALDSFELRDAGTNMISNAYGERPGEEIFHINKESFENTAFIEAGDCTAVVTDDINALIGNILEESNDINNYESASRQLGDLVNSLSSSRKTGRLYKMKDEITRLKREVKEGESIPQLIKEYEDKGKEALRKADGYKRTLDEITQRQELLSKQNDRRVKAARYKGLCEKAEGALAAYEEKGKSFPDKVPGEDELSGAMTKCGRLGNLAGGVEENKPDDNEEILLEEYKTRFGAGVPLQADIERMLGKAQEAIKLKEESEKARQESAREAARKVPARFAAFIAAGIACGAAGALLFGFGQFACGGIFMALCVLLVLAGILNYSKNSRMIKESAEGILAGADKAASSAAGCEEELDRFLSLYKVNPDKNGYTRQLHELERDAKEYLRLDEKSKRYSALNEEYKDGIKELSDFVAGYTYETPCRDHEGLMHQLVAINRSLSEYNLAQKAYEQAECEKEAFEQANDVSELKELPPAAQSLGDLQEQRSQVYKSLEGARDEVRRSSNEADALRGEYDEWSEKKERLGETEREYKELNKKYNYVKQTKDLLLKARESFIMKYASPVLESFKGYFGFFSETVRDEMKIDAALNLTRQEMGVRREIETQSSGYQEMIGFCLRAAYADAMYGRKDSVCEKPPLILDDPFMALDEVNAAAGERLLCEIAKNYQVIYLTCSANRCTSGGRTA